MINFFKNIRRQLANENKFQKYFRYAFGEILLVVVGILIALQINNWNENRKQEIEFKFSLKQFHEQLNIDLYTLEPIRDGYSYQKKMVDSLLYYPELLDDQKLPLIIQSLDYKEIERLKLRWNADFRKTLVKFNPKNKNQNRLAQLLSKNIQVLEFNLIKNSNKNQQNVLIDEATFQNYLDELDIPMQFLSAATSYNEFYNQIETGGTAFKTKYNYSQESLTELRSLLTTKKFVSSLTTYAFRLQAIETLLYQITMSTTNLIKAIEQLYPDIHLKFEALKITGNGTHFNNWDDNIDMEQMDDEGFVWELTTTLRNGSIKFVTDDQFTFDWGLGNMDNSKLCFDGYNIPTKEGTYTIKVNLKENTYQFIKQDD